MFGIKFAVFVNLIFLVAVVTEVECHGRMHAPPGRSTTWRHGFSTPVNYGDNQLFCGGFSVQYDQNGGKCGVCGDPYQGPRDNEPPNGPYATGKIVATYQQGQIITVRVEITASHLGYFEFRICPNNNIYLPVSQECLDDNLLTLASSQETRYGPIDHTGNYFVDLQLATNMTCEQCVLQWKYRAGNNWGCDETGCATGNGNQEEFYACSDVAITPGGTPVSPPTTTQGPGTASANSTTSVSTTTGSTMTTTTQGPLTTSAKSTTPVSMTTGSTTTASSSDCTDNFQCTTWFGYYADPCSCSHYYQCVHKYPVRQACSAGLVWNQPATTCDWPSNYHCPE